MKARVCPPRPLGGPAQAQRSGLRGERSRKEARIVFACGGNGAKRTLRRRCHAAPARDARLPSGSDWSAGRLCGPALVLAPVHPACSRRLRASCCHARFGLMAGLPSRRFRPNPSGAAPLLGFWPSLRSRRAYAAKLALLSTISRRRGWRRPPSAGGAFPRPARCGRRK